MNKFMSAMNSGTITTANGMGTNVSSTNACVDFFYTAGSMRGKSITPSFSKAYAEHPEHAIRLAQWLRDVRGGAGERQLYKDILVYLSGKCTDTVQRLLPNTIEHGRWDDILVLYGTPCQTMMLDYIKICVVEYLTHKSVLDNSTDESDIDSAMQIVNKYGLLFKWMPRKGKVAVALRDTLKLSPKSYRKLLVENTKVVETLMCSGKWGEIDYSKVPSLASIRYQKAFERNDSNRYTKYVDGLSTGETTIKSTTLYPYDIFKSFMRGGNIKACEAQWDGLPNYMEGSDERIFPMVDTSSSMNCSSGITGVSVLEIAISLGLYIAERNVGPYKDSFLTFSANPKFVNISGSLGDRLRQIRRAEWGFNTNIQRAYKVMLNTAINNKVPVDDMPTTLLILSDMEFDESDGRWGEHHHDMVHRMYADAGYPMPKIVYWNLRGSSDGVPVTSDVCGAGLVSGSSPSILKSVLSGTSRTPLDMMVETIMNDKYKF